MKTTFLLLLTFLLFLTIADAQVMVKGTLIMGDTTQVLLFETKRGDRFLGSINSWSRDSVTFRLGTGDMVKYQMSEVQKVVVQEQRQYEPGGDYTLGKFIVTSSDGLVREGQLKSLNRQGTLMRHGRNRRAYIRTSNVVEIELDETGEYRHFENYFRLRHKSGKAVFGQLLRLDDEHVTFQPQGRNPVKFDRADVLSLYQKRGYQTATGHQKALLVTPTGFNLKKGESEYRNINYVMTNSFSTGLSDHVSCTFGLFGIEPYIQLKAAISPHPYLHLSVGGGITLAGAAGWQAAASVGTPDRYLNLGFMHNKGSTTFSDTDMDAVFFGSSYRVGNRSRIIGEFIHIVERRELFEANGYGTNTFALAYGWFTKRASLNLGLMLAEFTDWNAFCFGPFGPAPCNNEENYYFAAIPVISTSVFFSRK